ncbi:hypothetical protein OBBRIDRAFT_808622 [Obba rivulosa]|uniref:Uncharacterized protein n=1 Tax=Obba rivulosa TaxID=1052685 RepID=A0A8E2AG97_9APHY|nr:hypothetical protein OBBRIDRAFT_808622 [Obba rivulosa]
MPMVKGQSETRRALEKSTLTCSNRGECHSHLDDRWTEAGGSHCQPPALAGRIRHFLSLEPNATRFSEGPPVTDSCIHTLSWLLVDPGEDIIFDASEDEEAHKHACLLHNLEDEEDWPGKYDVPAEGDNAIWFEMLGGVAPEDEQEDAMLTNIASKLEALALSGSEDESNVNETNSKSPTYSMPGDPWFPHGSKLICIACLHELGVTNVPSFKAFRHKQAQLNRAMPIQTQLKRSLRGLVFYQNRELAQLDNLQLVMPLARYCKQMHGDIFFEGYEVAWTGDVPQVTSTTRVEYPCSHLVSNVYELMDYGVHLNDHAGPLLDGIYPAANPLHVEAQGRWMYSSFVKIWVDNVSGNYSKQYNEHSNPYQKLSQEYFIYFISTSNHASLGDQLNAVVQDVQSPWWTQAFDLYEQHFAPVELWKAPETLAMVKAQLDQAATALRTQLQLGDHFNTLLQLDVSNVHDDTPVKILYMYLLGMAKYAWHYTNTPWTSKQCELFAIHLQFTIIVGLSIPPLRAGYMLQYRNSLIRKHFKVLQQLAIFPLDDSLCDRHVIDLWNATGELGSYLWYHEIENMDDYVRDIKVLIANLLDIWSLRDPRRVFVKPKLHILTHIVEDIRQHGPAGFMLSNHQAPSWDIVVTVAGLTWFKYQLQRHLGFVWHEPALADTEEVDRVRAIKKWLVCTSVVAEQGDSCPMGAWVFVNYEGETRFGCIKQILQPELATESLLCVVVERFTIWNNQHAFFQMPQVVRSEGVKHFVVDSQDHWNTAAALGTYGDKYNQRLDDGIQAIFPSNSPGLGDVGTNRTSIRGTLL